MDEVLKFVNLNQEDWNNLSINEKNMIYDNMRIHNFFNTTSPYEYNQKVHENLIYDENHAH